MTTFSFRRQKESHQNGHCESPPSFKHVGPTASDRNLQKQITLSDRWYLMVEPQANLPSSTCGTFLNRKKKFGRSHLFILNLFIRIEQNQWESVIKGYS